MRIGALFYDNSLIGDFLIMFITIINTLPVPSGNASVNRFLSYAKELVLLGNEVTVLSSGKSKDKDGIIDGVKYRNYGYLGLLKALLAVLKSLRKEKPKVVILVSNSLMLIYPIWLSCKTMGIKLLQEKSEFPFVLRNKSVLGRLYAKFYVNTTYKLFDGLIVMTKPLMGYFKDKVRKSAKLFEMPMTVDVDRFLVSKTTSEYGDYIAYCGDMSGDKDGVVNLIDAFDKASYTIHDVSLLLIGGSSKPNELSKIKQHMTALNNNRIVFYGRADRTEIPHLLVNAKALALARPSSYQSLGGFPTKLGEYLSTGNPVIVTKVGDIPLYLNEENAFVVEPDDNMAFAGAIERVFSDYNRAMEIGAKGKTVAMSVFNAKVQARRLHLFLESIV